ncbi:MAG: hypoxanthine phosphoribosyltransferase [Tenericutes bacterium HGW-Tenericutes-2]|jgi:hypoxanthine phosphoribosyltransferase/bifunctional protein TilS/HprT|nr:MAG: hypoxanthine phosphoribosyltransferase [Tenericutes bacterium HGW-Tenericutes-2]
MHNDIADILVSEKEIQEICVKLGKQITADYKDKQPIFVGLLKGCVPFMSDLARQVDLKFDMAYMSVSSYHGGIASSGDVKIKMDLDISVKDRDVLIVEDIVDTANTIVTIIDLLKHRGAKSVKMATLLDKPAGRLREYQPEYVGRVIPKEFVVGYGLDYDEYYRNLPYVGILKPEVYAKKS